MGTWVLRPSKDPQDYLPTFSRLCFWRASPGIAQSFRVRSLERSEPHTTQRCQEMPRDGEGDIGGTRTPMIPRPVAIYTVGATILTLESVGGHRQDQTMVMMTGDPGEGQHVTAGTS